MNPHRKKVILCSVGLPIMLLKTSEIFPSALTGPFCASDCTRRSPAIFDLRVVHFIWLSLRSDESDWKGALEADSILHAEEQYKKMAEVRWN